MKHTFRFFIARPLAGGERVCLDKEDAFHAAQVLRLKQGEPLEVADSGGSVFQATVTTVEGRVEVEIGEEIEAVPMPLFLTVAQALPKGRKMDLIVEKLSEVGVGCLAPVFSDKSVAGPSLSSEKVERWRRIAKSAAAQSRRAEIMSVAAPLPLSGWLEQYRGPLLALATEREGEPLGALACGLIAEAQEGVALVVGPESGFSSAELELLAAAGARFASLGPQIMRTETAALVASVIILHRAGALG